MKKLLGMILALLMCLSACAETTLKVFKERVLEAVFDELDVDAGAAYFSTRVENLGGCSAVKLFIDNKVYVGRNYDYYCTNAPAFIVRNNSGRYRTIGIACNGTSLPSWTEDYTLPDEYINVLPFLCVDVMSEAGIYCETNIRMYEDGLGCTSTNPGKPRCCTQMFAQIMLSAYGTIDEILAHVDDYDWYDLSNKGFLQSFMLTDKNGYSVVLEFAENTWYVNMSDFNANYFIESTLYAKENLPEGEQRVSRELAYKPFVRTEEDIFDMMATANYSQFFKADCDVDYAIGEWLPELGYTRFNIDENREKAREEMREILNQYDAYTWQELIDENCWETVFAVAANVTDGYMNVHFSEHYGINFTVAFD